MNQRYIAYFLLFSILLQSCLPSLTVPIQKQETSYHQLTRQHSPQDLAKPAEKNVSLQAIEPSPLAEKAPVNLCDDKVSKAIDSQYLSLSPVSVDKKDKQRESSLLSKTTYPWAKPKRTHSEQAIKKKPVQSIIQEKKNPLVQQKTIQTAQSKNHQNRNQAEQYFIEKELLGKTFQLKAGKELIFYQEEGVLKAKTSNSFALPVYIGDINLNQAIKPRYIHIVIPEQDKNKKGYVYIDRGGLMGGGKQRKGLQQAKEIESFLKDSFHLDGYKLGTADDLGDCFFDALAQYLNEVNNTKEYNTKSLRMLCHDFYENNKDLVTKRHTEDCAKNASIPDYNNIQYTVEEYEQNFDKGTAIWGRPWVEGLIINSGLKLKGICVIEVIQNEGKLTYRFHLGNNDSYNLINESRAKELINDNVPVLVVTKEDLHYVPLLKISATIQEEQHPVRKVKDQKQGNETNIEDEGNEERLQRDLNNLIQINALITHLLSDIATIKRGDEKTIVVKLNQIGQLIHSISWKEDDLICVRNKHGYRNRHKDKGNNINQEGAKLDFEALAHLKDLVGTKTASLLMDNSDLVQASLKILQQKINFILLDNYKYLNETQRLTVNCNTEGSKAESVHNVDEGFLKKVSAYYHDVGCINKLLSILESIDKSIYQSIDLTDKVDRYWLGYFFVQFGETAKEVSEYIKPEKGGKSEENIIRFLFSKLGHYRQKIKGRPGIIYKSKSEELSKIKEKFEEGKPNLKKFLNFVKGNLSQYEEKVDKYEAISTCLEKHNNLINNLTVQLDLNPIIKRKNSGLLEKLEGVENVIGQLQTAKDEFELKRKQNCEDKGQKKPDGVDSISKEIIAETFEGVKIQANIQSLKIILERYLILFPENRGQNVDTLNATLECFIKSNGSKKQEQGLKLARSLHSLLNKRLTKQSKTLAQQLSGPNLNKLTLGDFFRCLEDRTITSDNARDLELEKETKSLEDKIALKEKQIQEKVKEKSEIEEKIQAKVYSKSLSNLKKLCHEIENLEEIESSNSEQKLEFARKMSIGFIGQYCKELMASPNVNVKVKELLNHVLEDCIAETITTRHKYIMHDPSNPDHGKIQKTSLEYLLPSIKDFKALNTVINFNESNQALVELSVAFERLGKYDQALAVIQECHENISKGERLVKMDYDEFVPITEEEKYALALYKLLSQVYPPEIFSEFTRKVYETIDKMALLSHELDCHISKQDFSRSLQTANKLIDLAVRTRGSFFLNPIPGLTKGHEYVDSRYLYGKTQKSAMLKMLGKDQESYQVLKGLAQEADSRKFDTRQHANGWIRIYGDLIFHEPHRSLEYLSKMESLLKYCEDNPTAKFNYLIRKFDYTRTTGNGNELEKICKNLNKLFEKNKAQIRGRYGDLAYDYEMKLRLYELDIAYCDEQIFMEGDKDLVKGNNLAMQKIKNLFSKMEELFPKVQANYLRERYLKKRSIWKSNKKQIKEKQALVEKRIIAEFGKLKLRRAWSEIILTIPISDIDSGEIKYYCQSQLNINSKDLKFNKDYSECSILLEEETINILRNKQKAS